MVINLSFKVVFAEFSTNIINNPSKQLYKYLLRQCRKLPKGPREHYQFMVKQSFKQYVNETDPQRIKEIVAKSYENADWILKKAKVSINMFQVPLATSSTTLSPAAFWEAVILYHNRPHLINRKLLAVSQVLFYKILFNSRSIRHVKELFTRSSVLYEVRKLKNLSKECITEKFIRDIVTCHDKECKLNKLNIDDFENECGGVFISVRILMPRQLKSQKCMEIVILDKNTNSATFLATMELDQYILAPPFPYEIELTSNCNLRITLDSFENADTAQAEWIAMKLFPKFLKWTETCGETSSMNSLRLVPVDEYCTIYGDLKNKYGADLLKEWPKKTNTNPQKYIFEDIAIASYLIVLWKKYGHKEVNFVDCGCGNGLLVYILNQEGFKGYGIDIRRRPVWDIYCKETQLKVGTVTASSTFPESNWIIGNHSDELTPWIPVIALRSSPNTNFFVLPCCPYDFSGKKYIRLNTSVSQYSDYFDYVKSICEKCGYNTEVDKLRIPSTKRTCLVGIIKKMEDVEYARINNEINTYVENRMSSVNFKPRSETEKVRNCTQLDKDLIQRIVITCIKNLLLQENFIKKSNEEYWNKGASIPLSELHRVVAPEDLKQLKKECGGLQTLLRNHRYLFEIIDGKVYIREPFRSSEATEKYKSKPCWFLRYHPNGCLYNSEECAYQH